MTKVAPRKPGGFGEYLPGEQIEFNRLLDIVQKTYEKFGFTPLDTPDLELTDVLLAKGGGETEQQVYSFKREGSKTELTLRYDLTVPLARYVAEHESDLIFPFRRYHIGKVHRAERQQKGRFREFYQCDIDIIGSRSPVVDAEFPAVINEIFTQFGFGEFTIRLNNRILFDGLFEELGLDSRTSVHVLHAIDKMEKISHADLLKELAKAGLNKVQVKQVVEFTAITGTNQEILSALRNLGIKADAFKDGIAKLAVLTTALKAMGVPEMRYQIDLKITRGLDYYTGTVYETILNNYPELGSICSGGRYDDLAGHYTKTDLPGVGISIGLTRLFSKLREVPGLIQTSRQSPANIVVAPLGEEQIAFAMKVAALLRSSGISTMLYTEPDTVKKKLRFVSRMGFSYVALIGEAELTSGVVTLKDMNTGTETSLTPEGAAKHMASV